MLKVMPKRIRKEKKKKPSLKSVKQKEREKEQSGSQEKKAKAALKATKISLKQKEKEAKQTKIEDKKRIKREALVHKTAENEQNLKREIETFFWTWFRDIEFSRKTLHRVGKLFGLGECGGDLFNYWGASYIPTDLPKGFGRKEDVVTWNPSIL